jgi:hypothetical protein
MNLICRYDEAMERLVAMGGPTARRIREALEGDAHEVHRDRMLQEMLRMLGRVATESAELEELAIASAAAEQGGVGEVDLESWLRVVAESVERRPSHPVRVKWNLGRFSGPVVVPRPVLALVGCSIRALVDRAERPACLSLSAGPQPGLLEISATLEPSGASSAPCTWSCPEEEGPSLLNIGRDLLAAYNARLDLETGRGGFLRLNARVPVRSGGQGSCDGGSS